LEIWMGPPPPSPGRPGKVSGFPLFPEKRPIIGFFQRWGPIFQPPVPKRFLPRAKLPSAARPMMKKKILRAHGLQRPTFGRKNFRFPGLFAPGKFYCGGPGGESVLRFFEIISWEVFGVPPFPPPPPSFSGTQIRGLTGRMETNSETPPPASLQAWRKKLTLPPSLRGSLPPALQRAPPHHQGGPGLSFLSWKK